MFGTECSWSAGPVALSRPNSRIGIRSGRRGTTIALMAGLIGVALGGLALARSRRTGRRTT
ncbi:DUF6223 family protein [Micromonospora sp. LOL_024]|uniref:DUF6223 family protein n=1 Tax=Micromonospora sp. LOL_024 TaxID=3345412 RepID=UPI003A83C6FD